MPDTPAGVHILPPSYRVNDGDTTAAIQHNPPLEDLSQSMTNRIHRDGRTAWTGSQNANNNKITGLADGTSPQDVVNFRQLEGAIGDFRDSARDLSGGNYLRRDGSVYANEDYPLLAELMPTATSIVHEDNSIGSGSFVSIRRVTATRLIAITGTSGPTAGQVYSSASGTSWTQKTLTGFTINQASERPSAAFGNDIYMVCGHDSSFNQKVWTTSNVDSGSWTASGTIVTGGLTGPLTFFDGYFYFAHQPTGDLAKIYRSTNGSSWTSVHTMATISTVVDIRGGTNEIIVLQGNGGFARSTNGTTWTNDTLPENMSSLAWNESLARWVAGAFASATAYVSANGASWDDVDISFIVEGGVIVSDHTNGFVAVPISEPFTKMAVSTDGLDFFEVEGPGGTGTVRTVARNAQTNTAFIIGRNAGDYNFSTLEVQEDHFRVPSDAPTYGWIKAKESGS